MRTKGSEAGQGKEAKKAVRSRARAFHPFAFSLLFPCFFLTFALFFFLLFHCVFLVFLFFLYCKKAFRVL